MTPVFSARRRAEEFHSLIERGSMSADDTRYAEFLDVVTALRATPAPEARPEFVRSLRDQLMLAADTLLVPTPAESKLALPVRKPARERRLAAAVGGLAIVGATTSMAMAAQSALPGDVLYPLKRAIENAEAGFSVNDGQRGSTLLATASGRLDEVTALSQQGDADSPTIAETLNTFTEQATMAADLLLSDYAATGEESSIAELRDFTGLSMETLAELEALVPPGARDELIHAAGVLTQIDAEAFQACPDCGGSGISEIPKILTSSSGYAAETTSAVEGVVSDAAPDGGKKGEQGEPQVPSTDGGSLNTDNVLNPSPEPAPEDNDGNGGGTEQPSDPITDLTEGLTGGDSQPTNQPGLPGVPEVVDEVTGTVDGVTDAVTGAGATDEGKKKKN